MSVCVDDLCLAIADNYLTVADFVQIASIKYYQRYLSANSGEGIRLIVQGYSALCYLPAFCDVISLLICLHDPFSERHEQAG